MPITSGAPAHGNPAHLLPPSWTAVISAWLAEDTPSFDYGGFVVGAAPATARLLAKSPGILAGVPFVDEIFKQLECKVEWLVKEGELVGQNGKQHVATVTGPTRNLLLGERVALNVVARCSGIATKYVSTSVSVLLDYEKLTHAKQISLPPHPSPQRWLQKHPRRHQKNHSRFPPCREIRHDRWWL